MDHEAVGAGAGGGEFVVGVGQVARVQGQATAADAVGQVIAQTSELFDAGVEFVAPLGGDRGPVLAGGGAVVGQLVQGLTDAGQRDAHALGDADEGHPPQGVALVAALVAGRAATTDEALAFVEVQGRDGHSGAFGDLADGEFLGERCHASQSRAGGLRWPNSWGVRPCRHGRAGVG